MGPGVLRPATGPRPRASSGASGARCEMVEDHLCHVASPGPVRRAVPLGHHDAPAAAPASATNRLTCIRESLGGERRGEEHRPRASEECAPIHHWITSSARPSTDGGIVRPRALAVLRLMTSSNLLGCSIGMSPGGVPLKILSTKVAARLYTAGRLGP